MSADRPDKPLFGKSWKATYLLLLTVLAVLIALFYLFTITFS